ncbi:MAG: putative metal-binding motif-containing protein [Alphaproteobacteria bacterium]|nr:putative metal-binding motif-containing protein [Alphaproteobacteria bacterium]MCB9796118.1 putative metal-binding motif-containing protein [Alphaproteobacteria bacterium]
MTRTLFPLLLLLGCGEKDTPTDSTDDSGDPLADDDGDGFPASLDCDDGDADVYPEAEERCNDVDDDCDDSVDEEGVDGADFYPDGDGDGFGAGDGVSACEAPSGHVDNAEDCDDGDASVHPGADELCDDADQDCDDQIDEDPVDGGTWYPDDDDDGYGDMNNPQRACEQPEGTLEDGSDCDDDDGAVNPEGWEWCDGYDDDCDGLVDDEDDDVDPTTFDIFRLDNDGDGYGGDVVVEACEAPSGTVERGGDCDDDDATVHPGAAETWYDGVDQDCDNRSDYDADSDGADSDAYGGGDCDDADSGVYPGYDESVDCADPVDRNCDGSVGYDDLDGDGWVACMECDDLSATAFPYAWEEPGDGEDNDCDGAVDSADRDSPTQLSLGNDDSTRISLSNFSYPFCGSSWSRPYINSDGVVSFDGSVLDPSESQGQFLGSSGEGPMIAALWDDLDPGDSSADGVYYLEEPDALIVWWRQVPENSGSSLNDITLVLLDDGRFITMYPQLSVRDGLVGWSCGDEPSVSETDLSDDWANLASGAQGLGTGTDLAVFEHFKSSDNDAAGAAWTFCGNGGSDADGDGWTDVCGDTDDADASVYPQ